MYQKIMIAVFFFACRESGTGQGRVLGRSWQVIRTCAILTKRSVACRTVLLKYWSIFNAKTIKKGSDTGGTSTWGRLAVSSWKICNHMIGVLNCKLASQLWSGAQSHNIQESEILTCTVFPGSRPMLSRFFTPLLLLSFVTWCYSGWKELHTKMCWPYLFFRVFLSASCHLFRLTSEHLLIKIEITAFK